MSRAAQLGASLYRGEVSYDFVGRRRRWYTASAAILLVSVGALLLLKLSLGIEFRGGSEFRFTAPGATVEQARAVAEGVVKGEVIPQEIGQGTIRVQTGALDSATADKLQTAFAERFDVPRNEVSRQLIGPSWGRDISQKAIRGLVAFIVLVVIYLSIAFEWKMAIAAVVALIHDLVITVGVYALSGFEVTPATVIGLLTILGYSLYDTVVVFDKVRENTAGLAGGSRMTYGQAANLAVNQTLVRSINTSVIALLPVGALLFVGAGLLGAGTLKDLALALFVGIAAGTYSSIFIATPLLAQLKEREPQMQALARRVSARGAAATGTAVPSRAAARRTPVSAAAAAGGRPGGAGGSPVGAVSLRAASSSAEPGDGPQAVEPLDQTDEQAPQPAAAGRASGGRPAAPVPRNQPRKGASRSRPSGKKRR